MRKIFNGGRALSTLGTGLALASVLWLGGCGKPAEVSSAQSYTVLNHKMSMTPPKDWKKTEEKSSEKPEKGKEKQGSDQPLAIRFDPPSGGGFIVVTATDGVTQTKELMNTFYEGIRARKGTIIKQWYEHKLDDPDKENAYFMEYGLKDPGVGKTEQKGCQVQIFDTRNKVLYSLIFNADPPVYDAHRETFMALVKSFDAPR